MATTHDLAGLEARLRQHVATLAQSPRAPGAPAHRQAAAYIRAHLEQAGFTVQEAPFANVGIPGLNLLTSPTPAESDGPRLVVGAHYDSVPHSPGADDNASAVAALLELAAWIRPRLDAAGAAVPLQLAAYDLEEYGLVGSFVHSQELRRAGTPLVGMLSLEMLGYTDARPGSQGLPPHLAGLYPNVGNFIAVCANEGSQALLRSVVAGLKRVPGLPVEFLAVPGNGQVLPETRLSDHSSFWDRGYPALMVTDTSFFRNPHYHQATDTPQSLDYPFLARVTAGICEAVGQLVQGG